MIKKEVIEEMKGDYAICKKVVTFFGHTIYESIDKTTNINVTNQFKVKRNKVKGFKNED